MDRATFAVGATIQAVNEPGVDGAECDSSFFVILLDLGVVADEPEKLNAGRICGQGQAAEVEKLVSAVLVL